MVKRIPSKDDLMAVAAPRRHEAASLLDYVIYERGLELGAIAPESHPVDAKALYTLIVQAMTVDTSHRGIRPVVPPELSLSVDTQALAHVMRTAALHFKTDQPLSIIVSQSGDRLRIQCKSPVSKAIENSEELRQKLEQSLAILGGELDLDPLTPSSMAVLLPLPKKTRAPKR